MFTTLLLIFAYRKMLLSFPTSPQELQHQLSMATPDLLPLSFWVHVMEKMHLITLSGLWCLLGNRLPVSYSPKERGRQSLPDTHPSLYAQKQQKPLVHGLGPEPASEQQKQLPDRGQ